MRRKTHGGVLHCGQGLRGFREVSKKQKLRESWEVRELCFPVALGFPVPFPKCSQSDFKWELSFESVFRRPLYVRESFLRETLMGSQGLKEDSMVEAPSKGGLF